MPLANDSRPGRFFRWLGKRASAAVRTYLPDAFIFSLLLTFVAIAAATVFTDHGLVSVLINWGDGFWFVLTFSMQASLALLTGWAVAESPPVRRALERIAALPRTQYQAILATAIVGQLLGLFHWGVVLIAAAIFAREVGISMDRKGIDVHYPLLVATAYAGLLPWHQGLSGAALLLSATEGHFLQDHIGVVPVSETVFAPANLVIVGSLVALTVTIMPLMAPREQENIVTAAERTERSHDPESTTRNDDVEKPTRGRIASTLLESRLLCLGTGALIWTYLGYRFLTESFLGVFDLNVFIVMLFGSGFLLHGCLDSYASVFRDATDGASQILIQFQFYGGIMGVIVWSGLAATVADLAAQAATGSTWYLMVFLTAGTMNFFVPSGGGQWIVTGEVFAVATGNIQGATQSRMLIAYAMGDQWSNMIQPFWALPVLEITDLSARDIMGYTAVLFVFGGFLMGTGALLMGVGVL